MKITGLVSTLQTNDLDNSISFYLKLGFILDWKWPEVAPSHASFSSSGYSFMLEKIDKDRKPEKADLYFKVEEVNKLYQSYLDQNIQVSKLKKTNYGMLDFSIESPSGHHLVFGEPVDQ
jgi:hypothetical protein